MSAVVKVLTSTAIASAAQNTVASVGIQTSAKALGRPLFIMKDKAIDLHTKKFAASKEFLYQVLCFGIFAAMLPMTKKGGFKLYKHIYKNEHGFNKFKSLSEYDTYVKIASKPLKERNQYIQAKKKIHKLYSQFTEDVQTDLKTKENPNKYNIIAGSSEATMIGSSMLGFGVIAPILSGKIVRPVMNLFSKKEKS